MVERYKSLSLPEELLSYIDDVIEIDKFGYKTRAEFVKEAIRTSLRELDMFNISYGVK